MQESEMEARLGEGKTSTFKQVWHRRGMHVRALFFSERPHGRPRHPVSLQCGSLKK